MKAKLWVGLVAFCLWAGSAWLYDLFAPGVLTGLPRTAVHNGMVAAGCFGWALWRREALPGMRVWLRLAVGGAFLFAIPGIVLAGATRNVTQATEALVFLLVPVVVVFLVGQQTASFGIAGGSMRGLVPAVAGMGGAALILPFESPSSLVGRLWLAALIASAVAAAAAAVATHHLLTENGVLLAPAGAVFFGVSCLLSGSFCRVGSSGLPPVTSSAVMYEVLRVLLIDAPILLLGIWLLRAARPVAFSSRLLLVPAVTVLEGIIAERPDVGWYGWLGLGLMIGSGFLLARHPVEVEVEERN